MPVKIIISDELAENLRALAEDRNMSLQEYVIELLADASTPQIEISREEREQRTSSALDINA